MQSVSSVSIGRSDLIPSDPWHYYRTVLGNALDSAPDIIQALTNAEMEAGIGAAANMIEMGPFDVLEVLPLIGNAGTTAEINIIAWNGVIATAGIYAGGAHGTGWLGISTCRASLATPTADIGDISGLVSAIPNNVKGFEAVTLAGTPTQVPNITAVPATLTQYVSQASILRVRPRFASKMQVLCTGTSAVGDHLYTLVRRSRTYSGV